MEANISESPNTGGETKPKDLIVDVQFRRATRTYRFVSSDPTLAKGEAVMVESDDGPVYAFVVAPPSSDDTTTIPQIAKRVIRRANDSDTKEYFLQKEKALGYLEKCKAKVLEHKLSMKLVDAEIAEGGRKAVFYFYAEQRVDFRNLVKDLAQSLHMRIEMRQIGARDETKFMGCVGPCGLETCCSQHLRQFNSISISMAKQQGLTPNPTKLTGMCGKLKCCLEYECAAYQELRQGLPKLGAAVETEKGCGKISDLNILRRECTIQLYGGGFHRCPCSETKILSPEEREAAVKAAREAAEKAATEERPSRRGQRPPQGQRPAQARHSEQSGQKGEHRHNEHQRRDRNRDQQNIGKKK